MGDKCVILLSRLNVVNRKVSGCNRKAKASESLRINYFRADGKICVTRLAGEKEKGRASMVNINRFNDLHLKFSSMKRLIIITMITTEDKRDQRLSTNYGRVLYYAYIS